jgi:hypothetical protein
MSALLAVRGRLRMPPALAVWMGFLTIVVMSAVMLDSGGRAFGWLYRVSVYAAATAAFLYVFNSDQRLLGDRRIVAALVALWTWVVIGGWLGVLLPEVTLATPVSAVLPKGLLANDLVRDLVVPGFAEVQKPWGAPVAFARPRAPFPYANGWGVNFALLTILTVALWVRSAGRQRLLLSIGLAASTVPAAMTLNRGMLLMLGLALLYVALRAALAGRVALLAGIATFLALALTGAWLSGIGKLVELRTAYSSTNSDRLALYAETLTRALESPMVGWGGPRPSFSLGVSVGTQGHVWNVMFSHGFVALALFVGFLVVSAWQTRRARGLAFAGHVVAVVAVPAVFFYGFDGPQTVVVLVAAALAYRQLDTMPSRGTDTRQQGRHAHLRTGLQSLQGAGAR